MLQVDEDFMISLQQIEENNACSFLALFYLSFFGHAQSDIEGYTTIDTNATATHSLHFRLSLNKANKKLLFSEIIDDVDRKCKMSLEGEIRDRKKKNIKNINNCLVSTWYRKASHV